jgi:hypothetical protein
VSCGAIPTSSFLDQSEDVCFHVFPGLKITAVAIVDHHVVVAIDPIRRRPRHPPRKHSGHRLSPLSSTFSSSRSTRSRSKSTSSSSRSRQVSRLHSHCSSVFLPCTNRLRFAYDFHDDFALDRGQEVVLDVVHPQLLEQPNHQQPNHPSKTNISFALFCELDIEVDMWD